MSHTKLTITSLVILSMSVSAHHTVDHVGGYSIKEIWAYGIVASIGISMLALILSSAMIIWLRSKISGNKKVKLTVMILTAFAVGSLLGDTIVHIIPQIYRARTHDVDQETTTLRMLHDGVDHGTEETNTNHGRILHNGVDHGPEGDEETSADHGRILHNGVDHGAEGAEEHEETSTGGTTVVEEAEEVEPQPDPAITSLLILVGFGAFIILEKLFDLIGAPSAQKFQEVQAPEGQIKYAEVAMPKVEMALNGKGTSETMSMARQDSSNSQGVPEKETTQSSMSCAQKLFSLKGRRSAGVLLLMTNFIHNIVDGLAIGGTFSTGNEDIAITTFIAVLLHQIPHGIGDMGILLDANFPIMQAMVWRGLINFSTIIGASIGLATGLINEVSNAYLLGFVAGNLMYIALVNMLPPVMKESRGWKSVGMLAAFVVGAGWPFALLAINQ